LPALSSACAAVLVALSAGVRAQLVQAPQAQTQPALAATAQAWRFEPAVRATAVTTDNVGLSPTNARADTVTVTTPSLRVIGRGPGYEVTGTVAADGLVYLGRSLADRIFPQVGLAARSQLVDRLLYLDGDLSARTTASDAFGPIGDGATTLNRSQVMRASVSPRIERELSPSTRFSLRSDHAWSRGFGSQATSTSNDAYVEGQAGIFEVRPAPMGLRVTGDRQYTSYRQQDGNDVEFRTGRAALLYTANQEAVWGLIVGRDEGDYTTNSVSDTLTGVSLRWAPSPRTLLDMTAEKRFFGNGWNVTLSHRSPFVAISGNLQRTVSTYASRLGLLTAGSDVASLLDAMLTTRVSDAAQRAQLVQDIMARRGLPATLATALDLFSGGAQVSQGGTISLGWMTPRDVITAQFYAQRLRDLRGPNDVILISADSRQRGLSLGLSHRLTMNLTADAGVAHSRVHGEGPNLGRDSVNTTWRVGVTEVLSPRTTATASLRRQVVRTNAPGGTALDGSTFAASSSNANANSLSVGVLHRF
jgi:uncharacterized protein (PEP-CTERM system associated)